MLGHFQPKFFFTKLFNVKFQPGQSRRGRGLPGTVGLPGHVHFGGGQADSGVQGHQRPEHPSKPHKPHLLQFERPRRFFY